MTAEPALPRVLNDGYLYYVKPDSAMRPATLRHFQTHQGELRGEASCLQVRQ